MTAQRTSGSGERLLSILDLFTEDRLVWSPQDMMTALGYSRPTLYRYLRLLRETGFIAPRPGGNFGLGPRFVELDFLVRKSDPLIARGHPHLAAIAERFPGTAFIVQWYGDKLLCVASASRDETARTSYPRGRPMPLTSGAASKVIVAHLPRQQRRRLAEIHASGPWGNTMEDVLAALRQVRREGKAIAYGEVTPGIIGMAAPILDDKQHPLGSLCVSMDAVAHAKIDTADLAYTIQRTVADITAGMAEDPSVVSQSAILGTAEAVI